MATSQPISELQREEGRTELSGANAARRRVLAGLPVTERRIQLGGVSTAVLEGGEGPLLILLHGGIECGGAYWAPVISRLAQAHRLVVPDVPGLGESEPVARLDAAFAEWFAALLRTTCDERPTLVAHSLLGHPAARFAAGHPDLLRRLVIYGAPGLGRYRVPLGLMLAAIRFNLRPTQRNQERFEEWAFLDSERTKRRDPEWFAAFDAYSVACGALPHVKRTMRRLIRTSTKQIADAELRAIEIPTALLWGRHDRMISLGLGEAASVTLGWPLHVVDDAGHAPHLEQPDLFVDALLAAIGP